MFRNPKRERISPDFIAIPAEMPTRTTERRELLLILLDEEITEARALGDAAAVDDLLTGRWAIIRLAQPEVPVIPGRTS